MATTFTYRGATRFYVPLVIQTAAQSLVYPLVAMVVLHGPEGTFVYAAFAQGLAVLAVLNALCHSLLTTLMVYGRSRHGFRRACRLNVLCMVFVVALHVLCGVPPVSTFIFARMAHLPPESVSVAGLTVLLTIPTHIAFFLRNAYSAILFNALASHDANMATLWRIGVTVVLACACVYVLGFTGPVAGAFVFAFPAACEALATWLFARPYLRRLPEEEGSTGLPTCAQNTQHTGQKPRATLREQLGFTVPLTAGNALLAFAGFITAAFIGRSDDGLRMLSIHFVALGFANLIASGAACMQTVTLTFASADRERQRKLFLFALAGGVVFGVLTLSGKIPFLARFYFGTVQNLSYEDIPLAVSALLVASLFPVVQAVRGYVEGVAAYRKRPAVILAGNIAYLAILSGTLYVALRLGVPGNLMGMVALVAAVAAAATTIYAGLRGKKEPQIYTDYHSFEKQENKNDFIHK